MSIGILELTEDFVQINEIMNFNIVIALIPAALLFISCLLLFFREAKLDRKQFLEEHQLADEHILKEVERFLAKMR